MSENLKKFREFVEAHPQIKENVKNKEGSWQKYYEDFIILGPYDSQWKKYESVNLDDSRKEVPQKVKKDILGNTEFLKQAYGYIKKIDTDKVTKGLGNAQKVLNIFQGFVGGSSTSSIKKTGDPLFDKRFDDWY